LAVAACLFGPTSGSTAEKLFKIPGTNYYINLRAVQPLNAAASQSLLAAISDWLSKEVGLPVISRFPEIKPISSGAIDALRAHSTRPAQGETAEDGQRGCEMAVTERPDIILMDLQMPIMDGWEAARRLKSTPETSDIPIIGLSAHALAGERDKALAAGCDEFDTKPVELECLVATIRRICEMKLTRKAG
jgi:CheY-like chemotaxis protein